jgi:hypothetical protein
MYRCIVHTRIVYFCYVVVPSVLGTWWTWGKPVSLRSLLTFVLTQFASVAWCGANQRTANSECVQIKRKFKMLMFVPRLHGVGADSEICDNW